MSSTVPVSVRIPKPLLDQVKEIAACRQRPYQTVLKELLATAVEAVDMQAERQARMVRVMIAGLERTKTLAVLEEAGLL